MFNMLHHSFVSKAKPSKPSKYPLTGDGKIHFYSGILCYLNSHSPDVCYKGSQKFSL